jgi:hypothetical protein
VDVAEDFLNILFLFYLNFLLVLGRGADLWKSHTDAFNDNEVIQILGLD